MIKRDGGDTVEREYDFIVNPKARSGNGELIWRRLEPELKKRRLTYRVHMTGQQGHARIIAEELTADGGERTLVVLGGDGTVNEVINGICHPQKITLGYIPIGSSNDFARGLGLPNDPKLALDIVLGCRRLVHMDIGELSFENGSGNVWKTRRFLVSAGMGFDAAVCHEVSVSRMKVFLNRLGLGKLSYAAVALHRLVKDRPEQVVLTLPDGEKKVFDKTYFAAFMNLGYEGGGFHFCPEASPEDGALDVILAHGLSLPKILFLLPLAFGGKHVGFKGIDIIRCESVRLEARNPLLLHTDGEPESPRRCVRAGVLGEKLKVIVGQEKAESE